MAPNPRPPRQPRKPNSGGGGPRRGRPPRKHEDEETKTRGEMPLPTSLLDTTIADGEEYRPGNTLDAPATPAPSSGEVERGNERIPPPPPPAPAFVPFESRESEPPPPQAPVSESAPAVPLAASAPQGNGGPQNRPQPPQRPNYPPQQGGGRHDRYFDRNRDRDRDRRHGGQPYHDNRPPRVPLTPEEEAARAAQIAAP